jgi:hypothetical protein
VRPLLVQADRSSSADARAGAGRWARSCPVVLAGERPTRAQKAQQRGAVPIISDSEGKLKRPRFVGGS